MAVTKRAAKPEAGATSQPLEELAEAVDTMKADVKPAGCGRLCATMRFPMVVMLSFCMASLGYSLVGELSKGQLPSLTRSQDTWCEMATLAGWRIAELSLAWMGNLDALDVAMLDVLSHGPLLFLLSAFYSLSSVTAACALAVDVLAAAVPFYLLRPLSEIHRGSAKASDRELIDIPLQLYTTALSTGIYTVIIVLSLRFVLPSTLVIYFSGLPTIEPAYTASYGAILPATLLFGAAANAFIFTPFAKTGKSTKDDAARKFDPVTATLGQTVRWNLWGYTSKTKVVILRTGLVMLVTGVNTYLACSRTVYGAEATGAAWYAAVWVFAALCTGTGLGLVGGD